MNKILTLTLSAISFVLPALSEAASITRLSSKSDLDALVKRSQKPIVLKVFATWCHQCQKTKPHFIAVAEELSNKYLFAEADFDQFDGIELLNTRGVPTFIMYKNGAEAGRFAGGVDAPEEIKTEMAKFIQ